MSRIVVKNLPKKITAQKLQDAFSSKGCITDLQLKYTKEGVFRQFAFIGYKTEQEAQDAKEYFHNTYISASKIQVEVCANLGDSNKPRAWSRYSKEKSTPKKEEISEKKEGKKDKSKKDGKKKSKEFPEELEKNPQFAEFLEVNKVRSSKPLWGDTNVTSENNEEVEEEESSDTSDDEEAEECGIASRKDISDMEYFKSKVESSVGVGDNASSEKAEKKTGNLRLENDVLRKGEKKGFDDRFTVKLRNLPFKCKKKQLKMFFSPIKLESIRIPPKSRGFAYVKFKTEKEMKQALNKHKGFLEGHRIDVVKYEKKIAPSATVDNQDEEKDKQNEAELLAESGRIFVRNLCFDVTEEELETLFSKYGPLAEIHLPIDSYTKKGSGFAFVSFVFAEHSVKAFDELDGTVFQGRLLHLIPGKSKQENVVDINDLPFKKRKEAKLKMLSGNAYNWNTLFLGLNAVADVMAKQYNIEKSELLNNEDNESIAVRMALGETQLVVETRQFLLDNGVQLDSFSQPAAERSKTVIIVKNLPAKTASSEIHEVFSKYGVVSRVVLPPSGVTALIEFQQATEAKAAFKKLAYSRFQHVPLYLEWAPMNVFKKNAPNATGKLPHNEGNEIEMQGQKLTGPVETHIEDDISELEPGTTLFVKNLNFETTEDKLKKHFEKCGPVHLVSVSKKKDLHSGKMLSMGFGFVQFKKKSSASTALQDLQYSKLDDHKLELKYSNRATISKADAERKKAKVQEQKSSKILVRNIPFEITEKDIRDLFKEFGNLKSVRLPKKPTGNGTHRGFCFVDFSSKNSAKRAFNTLCHSTHLLGRRLVLEWANEDADDVSELRKKTARDFYIGGPAKKVKKSRLMEDVMLASANKVAELD